MSEKRFTLTDWHEVKDNGKIMTVDEVVGKLNRQQTSIETMLGNMEKLEKENKQLQEKNKQIGYLKRDLFILINLIRDTPMEFNYDFEKIVERWE